MLLEREAQVVALEALADAARSGAGQFVVIEGSAGIGKTRLLAEARAIAGSEGMRVLAARGGEFEGEFAYGIVRQLFEPLLASAAPDLRAELLSGPATLIEPLFEASQLDMSQDAPTAEGLFAILHGLYWLAANVAFQQPTLLAIDDLHWADTSSLQWLLYLTRRLDGVPLLVAAGTRPPEGEGREPTLVAELVADPEAAAIRPEPLGRASIAVLARELHGLEPDEIFSAALETATGGNPLFVSAVLDAVAREGTSPTAEHVPRLLEIGAQGVSRAVGLRLARLTPEALALLHAAAILGDGAELRHAAALAGVEAGDLGPAVAGLVRLDLLRHEDPLEFFHPVVRSAVYETLDVVERDAAHRSAAELLLQAGALPESAGHLLRVAPQADAFVVSTLRQAAERSLAQGGADAAVGYLTRALDEQIDPAAQAEVLFELGYAERRTNGPAAADHLRAGLELLADPARRGAVALELGRALWFTDRIADAFAVFERALDEVDRKRNPDLYELLLAELISSAGWDAQTYPIGKARLDELDPDALHGGLGSEILLATMAHYEYRLGLHRELAVELARRALAPGNLLASGSFAFYYAAMVPARAGLHDEAVSIFDQVVAQARRRGDILNVALMSMFRGYCQTRRGDLRAAVADLREAIDLSVAHGMLIAWPYTIGFLAHALLEQGNTDEATRVIDQGDFPEQLPLDQLSLVWFRLHRGRLRIETGSPERGVEELLQVGETVRLIPFDNPSGVPWRSWAAEGLRLLDRNDEARTLADEELALARRWGDPHAIGASLRVLGLLEGSQGGIALLREAVEVLARSEARLEHARALVDLGAALRRANQRTEARERLREGVDLAQRLGAFGLAEQANEEIAATGARPRKILQTGLDALTATERRVAQLAAEGMTNKEIAQTLFVTIKTVEVHLSSAYRKLEISSRAQLDKALFTPAPSPAPASA